jgi:hypothetical protein
MWLASTSLAVLLSTADKLSNKKPLPTFYRYLHVQMFTEETRWRGHLNGFKVSLHGVMAVIVRQIVQLYECKVSFYEVMTSTVGQWSHVYEYKVSFFGILTYLMTEVTSLGIHWKVFFSLSWPLLPNSSVWGHVNRWSRQFMKGQLSAAITKKLVWKI